MKTDDLIDLLGADTEPAPSRERHWPLVLALALAGAFALLAPTLGIRPDLAQALAPTALKMAVSLLIAAGALALVANLSKPGRRLSGLAVAGAAILAVAAGFALYAAVIGVDRLQDAQPMPRCLVYVPLYALPGALLIGWVVRGLAPTRLALTGAAIGAAAGGIGAIAYAAWCPYDQTPLFTLSFYVLSIALCASAGALLGPRALRW